MRGRKPIKPGQWRKVTTIALDPVVLARVTQYAKDVYKGNRSEAIEQILNHVLEGR